MALLERVSALIRANLNDLIDRAEDPQKMLKQVILDMQNQMLQVKTQVAIAIADEHLLGKKLIENEEKHAEWMRKAELAVDKKQEELARAALERAVGWRNWQTTTSRRNWIHSAKTTKSNASSPISRPRRALLELPMTRITRISLRNSRHWRLTSPLEGVALDRCCDGGKQTRFGRQID